MVCREVTSLSPFAPFAEAAAATPPTLTVSLSPSVLWPPNHQMVTIAATIIASDDSGAAPDIELVSIVSSEPDNDIGDGHTTSDIQDAAFGTDDRTFKLRAERSGRGAGRIYTVTYRTRDAAGNTTGAQAVVVVPHSRR